MCVWSHLIILLMSLSLAHLELMTVSCATIFSPALEAEESWMAWVRSVCV